MPVGTGYSGAAAPSRRPLQRSRTATRMNPYPFTQNLSRRLNSGESAQGRVQLAASQEPAIARSISRSQSLRNRPAPGFQAYQGSGNKVPGRDYVRIPAVYPYQQEQFYRQLPYRIQGQLFKNPYTQAELNLERLSPGQEVTKAHLDNVIFTHTGFQLDSPPQVEFISTQVDLLNALDRLQQYKHFALEVCATEDQVANTALMAKFPVNPVNPNVPTAIFLSIAGPDFFAYVFDLRVLVQPNQYGLSKLPAALEAFLHDRDRYFYVLGPLTQSWALQNLCGLQLLESHASVHLPGVSVVSIGELGTHMTNQGLYGRGDFLRWVFETHHLPWLTGHMIDNNIAPPEACALPVAAPMQEVLGLRSLIAMYGLVQLTLRVGPPFPPELRALGTKLGDAYSQPTVVFNKLNLNPGLQIVFDAFVRSPTFRQLVPDLRAHAERARQPRYCYWMDGAHFFKQLSRAFTVYIQGFHYPAEYRQLLWLNVLLETSKKWRLSFEPQKGEPGSTISEE